MRRHADSWLLVAAVCDQVLLAAVLTWTWRLDANTGSISVFAALVLVPFWSYLLRYFGLYDSHRLDGRRSVTAATVTASTIGVIAAASALTLAGLGRRVPDLVEAVGIWMVLVLTSRAVLYHVLWMVRRRGADRRYVCVIGTWQSAEELAAQFEQHPEWGLQVNMVGVGVPTSRTFYTFGDGDRDTAAALGHELERVLHERVIDEIVIVAHPAGIRLEQQSIELSRRYGVQCRLWLQGEDLPSTQVDVISGRLAVTMHGAERNQVKLGIKRAVDLVLSATLLVLLAPVFLVVALLVRLSSPGPVFYRQLRTGLRGRRFELIKFRTMIVDADAMLQLVAHRNITGGPIFKDARDWRVTPIGRILRRFSLDELPQLWNVLRGQMSLVGPRPLPLYESVAIEGVYRRRFTMKPGITCRWQVGGRSEIGFAQWMQSDVEYVDNWTLTEDAKLLLLTVPAVLSGKGAY